jgi:hypothetical protein
LGPIAVTTYAQPPTYTHGSFPTDTDTATATTQPLQVLSDNCNAIAELITDGTTPAANELLPKRNPAIYWNREKDDYISGQNDKNSDFCFTHTHRYLHYKSSGTIEDIAGLESAVSLPNESTYNVYDLDTVSWLVYGMAYLVRGVDFCAEDVDP